MRKKIQENFKIKARKSLARFAIVRDTIEFSVLLHQINGPSCKNIGPLVKILK